MSEYLHASAPEPSFEDLEQLLYELADTPGSAITDELRQRILSRHSAEDH